MQTTREWRIDSKNALATTRVSFVGGKPGQRGFSQANRIALTSSCHCYNSSRDDFAHYLRLASDGRGK
jgi:hypothetical protein